MRHIIGNPYDEIGEVIEKWCQGPSGRYGDFLVTVLINGEPSTHVLEFDANSVGFIWSTDWWEGEKDVVLYGFMPIADIVVYGEPGIPELEDGNG